MNPARVMVAKSKALAAPSSATILLRSSWNVVSITTPAAVGGVNALLSQRRRASSSLLGHQLPLSGQRNNNNQQHQLLYNYQHKRYFARDTKRLKFKRGIPKNQGDHLDKYSFEDVGKKQQRVDKNILVIGSSGILGKTLVSHFGHNCDWNVIGADVLDPKQAADEKGLRDYIQLPKEGSMADLTGELYRGVSLHLQGGESNENKLDAIVCASGGWAGDVDVAEMMENHLAKANSSELEDIDMEEEYARESAEVCERMMRVNYYPIVAGSQVGRRFMKPGGLFCMIGASAALSPTPGMLGYGSAKSAAHHYLQSWGPTSFEENGTTAVGILPLMIDTPSNREMLGGDDADGGDDRYSKMVKPIHIANEIGEWVKQPHLRPHTGSLVKVIAKNRRDGSGGAAFHLVR
mmetsp:Transcript_12014/g.22324  ORF Transcript_12014/g.22324 Transcript_12014/m.22324 type:complete len:406 (+) Transcript_12014:1-1218(+)